MLGCTMNRRDAIRRIACASAAFFSVSFVGTEALADGLGRVFTVVALFGFVTLVSAWLVPKRTVWTRAEARGDA